MESQKEAIKFIVVNGDNLIIPCFHVHLCNFEKIQSSFIDDWNRFIKTLQKEFVSVEESVKELKNSGYSVVEENHYMVVLPPHWKGGFISNYPDLFDSTSDQLFSFLSQSKIELDDLKIKNNQKHYVVNYKPSQTTFVNLGVADSKRIAELAEEQGCCKRIWLSILIWWKYGENDDSPIDLQTYYVKEYCQPELFRCNNFIMIYSRAKQLKNETLLNWLKENECKVIWDEDLMSEIPTHCMDTCSFNEFENIVFAREKKRR